MASPFKRLKQVKLLFGPLVIQLVWYILNTSVSVKVVDIYLHFVEQFLIIDLCQALIPKLLKLCV